MEGLEQAEEGGGKVEEVVETDGGSEGEVIEGWEISGGVERGMGDG